MLQRRDFIHGATLGAALSVAVPKQALAAQNVVDCASGFVDVVDHYDPLDPLRDTWLKAFRLAATDAQTNKCVLWIPPGDYDVSGDSNPVFSVGTSSLYVLGAGRDLVKITGQLSMSLLRLTTSAASTSVRIEGISADTFYSVVDYAHQIDFNSIEVLDCHFSNMRRHVIGGGSGVRFEEIKRLVFERNSVDGVTGIAGSSAYVVGLAADKCHSVSVQNNIIKNLGLTTETGERIAIYLNVELYSSYTSSDPHNYAYNSEDIECKSTVTGNQIFNVHNKSAARCSGILVLSGQTIISNDHLEEVVSIYGGAAVINNDSIYTKCTNSIISGNTLINCGGSQAVIMCKGTMREDATTQGAGTPGYDNLITGNTIRQDRDLGHRVSGVGLQTGGCMISDNFIIGVQRGVTVWAGAKMTMVSNNKMFALSDYDQSHTVNGVVAIDPDDCMIVGNMINESKSKGVCYTIFIETTGNGTKYAGCLVKGNWIRGVVTDTADLSRGIAVHLPSTSITFTKIIIESNHIRDANWGLIGFNLSNISQGLCVDNTFYNDSGDHNSGTMGVSPAIANWNI